MLSICDGCGTKKIYVFPIATNAFDKRLVEEKTKLCLFVILHCSRLAIIWTVVITNVTILVGVSCS